MKLILLFGCIILSSVGVSTVRATAEQCDAMFEALVNFRSNLTALPESDQDAVQKGKKMVLYWTNVNVDDDVQLRQVVCQVVNANSINEMAAALRIPRTYLTHMYMRQKLHGQRIRMSYEEMIRIIPPAAQRDRRVQAVRSFVNVMDVAVSTGLLRFEPSPPSRYPEPRGCQTMMQRGMRLYKDRQLFIASQMRGRSNERFRVATGIDLDDRDQIGVVLCKLGEVSDLTELAAVFNVPVRSVRQLYRKIVPIFRSAETRLASGDVPRAIPKQVVQNMLDFMRGIREVGLLDLTD